MRAGLGISLAVALGIAFAAGADTSAQGQGAPEELLSLYERAAYDVFDERVRVFAAAPGSASAFKRAADRWIEAGANPQRRRLIAAAVVVEVSAVLSDWRTGPDFVDAGRSWLRSSGDGEPVRQWYRAALGATLAHADADALLATEDFGEPFRDPKYRGYSNEALRRFRDDPILLLFRSIAFETKWSTYGRAEWLDRDAVERELQSIKRAVERQQARDFPMTARVDVASAERMFKPDVVDLRNVQSVAEVSVRLWRVANMFRELQRDRRTAAEATLRLAVTYERLAQPDSASRELARALDAPASAFVTYMVHFLNGRRLAKAGRNDDAEAAYGLALRAVPDAQAASFALVPLLFESGRRREAERVVTGALRVPLVTDPIKVYGGGDPGHLRDALARLRQELQ